MAVTGRDASAGCGRTTCPIVPRWPLAAAATAFATATATAAGGTGRSSRIEHLVHRIPFVSLHRRDILNRLAGLAARESGDKIG